LIINLEPRDVQVNRKQKDMEKVNEIFFAGENEKGLTSSSANFLANMASEQVARTAEFLEKANFVNTELAIIGHQDRILSDKGMTSETFNKIQSMIERHGKLKSFCAWIREAIKAKDRELALAKAMVQKDYVTLMGIELPKDPELPEKPEEPEKPEYPSEPVEATERDVLETWSIKDRARYFEIEAMASTYGKLIHQSGAINAARDILHAKIASPVHSEGRGRETVVEYYTPSIPVELVDNLFDKLQDLYRSYEKELNSMKFRIKEEMEKLTQERYKEYNTAVAVSRVMMDEWYEQMKEYRVKLVEWNKECTMIKSAYNSQLRQIRANFEAYKSNLINETSKLKIRIPEAILDIFNELNAIGK